MNPNAKYAATDEQLATLFLESPESYREAFSERCADLLYAHIRKLVCGRGMYPASASRYTFADDVFSLALCRLAKSLDQLKFAGALQQWLGTIAKSAVLDETFDRVRRNKSGPIRLDSLDDLVARASEEPKAAKRLNEVESTVAPYRSLHWRNPEEIAITTERHNILNNVCCEHSAGSNKGSECGDIIALHYEQEMSFSQIAHVLSRPKSTLHEIIQDNMIAYRKRYKQILGNKKECEAGSTL